MSTYAVRIYNNDDDDAGAGSPCEYDMHTSHGDTSDPSDVLSEDAVRLRLLEAQTLNMASIAQSLDRIAATLDAMFNNAGWGR